MALQISDFNESFWFRKIGEKKSNFHYQRTTTHKAIQAGSIYLDYILQGSVSVITGEVTLWGHIAGVVHTHTMDLANYEKIEPTKLTPRKS